MAKMSPQSWEDRHLAKTNIQSLTSAAEKLPIKLLTFSCRQSQEPKSTHTLLERNHTPKALLTNLTQTHRNLRGA